MTVKVALIGTGGIAKGHREHIAANNKAKLVAVCDIHKETAERVAGEHGVAAYTDYAVMLEKENIDAVFLCVPPFAHGTIEEELAARGIHLFSEKPIGLDPAIAENKLAVIKKAGILTSTGYCLRYLDIVEQALDYLRDKTIAMTHAHYLCGLVETPWWRVMAKSGGQLVEQTTHIVDLIRCLAGDIERVYASAALRVMGDVENLDIPDVCSVNLTFASGAVGSLDSSFTQPDMRTAAEVFGRDFRLGIYKNRLIIRDKSGDREVAATVNPYKAQDDAFIDAILTGDAGKIKVPYEEALRSLRVSVAANQSAASGLPVVLEPSDRSGR
ncbi:MAG: Gfo/Idh/MocA family oxidoreductase [Paenibacillaceae bacterium]|nr:Gfo/Idh/MocA family oxidoreductase [Paenibacillaceae bacterium]